MPFLAALLPAVIGGAAALGGAAIAANSAKKAQKAQDATNAKVDAYGAPYRAAGAGALGSLETAYGLGDPNTLGARRDMFSRGFEDSPLYKYTYQPAVDEATAAVERNASASGLLNSGRTLKAIQDRAARIGGQTFGNYLSGLETIAGRGQNAAFQQGAFAMQGTAASNQAGVAQGNALQGGLAGVSNAAQQGINNYNYLKGISSYGPSLGVQAFNSGNPIY
jgi:hypothetical protein